MCVVYCVVAWCVMVCHWCRVVVCLICGVLCRAVVWCVCVVSRYVMCTDVYTNDIQCIQFEGRGMYSFEGGYHSECFLCKRFFSPSRFRGVSHGVCGFVFRQLNVGTEVNKQYGSEVKTRQTQYDTLFYTIV
jgi:hypothetical protein